MSVNPAKFLESGDQYRNYDPSVWLDEARERSRTETEAAFIKYGRDQFLHDLIDNELSDHHMPIKHRDKLKELAKARYGYKEFVAPLGKYAGRPFVTHFNPK